MRALTVASDADHPRSRGVYAASAADAAHAAGSSPLARGLPEWEYVRTDVSRIIPARAGFTVVSAPVTGGDGDHPRSRGVYHARYHTETPHGGSSPLARGLPGVVSRDARLSGIIPARAGFTPAAHRGSGIGTDHPRSRGVYMNLTTLREGGRGSSPLARGLLAAVAAGDLDAGIIPARAGFTRSRNAPSGRI